jgi:hypothetical protein
MQTNLINNQVPGQRVRVNNMMGRRVVQYTAPHHSPCDTSGASSGIIRPDLHRLFLGSQRRQEFGGTPLRPHPTERFCPGARQRLRGDLPPHE